MSNKKTNITEIDWDVIDGTNTEFELRYPRLQWVIGVRQASGFAKTGGFFMPSEQFPDFKADGFTAAEFQPQTGDAIAGYGAAEAHIAVIRMKEQWATSDEAKNIPYLQALIAVKGCDDLICLSLKGPSKALAFKKAFNLHMSQHVAFANRTRPAGANPLEPFSLWMHVRAAESYMATSKDGSKQSAVTPPELVSADSITREHVVGLWIGRERYQLFSGYFKETEQWSLQPILQAAVRDETDHNEHDERDGLSRYADPVRSLTAKQMEAIKSLVAVKNITSERFAEMVFAVSDNATSNMSQLTVDEAATLIDTLTAA